MIEVDVVYNRDCIEGMMDIPDGSIDLIVTDPPYLVNYKTGMRNDKEHRFNKVILNDDNFELVSEYIEQCHRILKENSAMYLFCSSTNVDFFKQELEKRFKIKNMIIWYKNHHTAGDLECAFGRKYEIVFLVNKGKRPYNGERLTDVWEFKRVSNDNLIHQNQKPVELIEQCILKHSNKGDLVFDGFMGSGTTAEAAMNTGRRYIGFELDPYYFDVLQKRLNSYQTVFEF